MGIPHSSPSLLAEHLQDSDVKVSLQCSGCVQRRLELENTLSHWIRRPHLAVVCVPIPQDLAGSLPCVVLDAWVRTHLQ